MAKIPFKSIKELKPVALKGKYVLVRTDFNVPVDQGRVTNNFRLKQALPTLEYLRRAGARVLVISHTTGPTLKPMALELETFIKAGFSQLIFDDGRFQAMPDGSVMVLENLRGQVEEEKNSESLAKRLASLADVYVNDAFSASHRRHASIVSLPKHLPSYAGLNFGREYTELSKIFKAPKPFTIILGGAKFSTKLPLVESLLPKADHIFVGGALAHTFFRKLGYEIGKSLVEEDMRGLTELLKNKKIILPTDVVVKTAEGSEVKQLESIRRQDIIVDVGPATLKQLSKLVRESKFILWNGPLGNFEKGFAGGTEKLARIVARADAYSVVGGGDTVAAIENLKLAEKFNHLSTAGGAMMEFLATGTLPGIEALK
ncbi:MAG: phosphoglycerate kinase [Candidatus Vogelbacteria bacterium RIFOXYD1_FULL_46_19]|uniref:Phosphoglycerate kinase n=1 Tax=Candidatus Vogelbacteria bacterium RIFOXYD1_FULL_46_19 TaxID=1802439 RepID=A0A1G2QIE1_9BACT|nr:MAG: phosphoglycerate kinase [Candidatus Vogelbacteria bacterium RIFOXYD1_FULL_46_19]